MAHLTAVPNNKAGFDDSNNTLSLPVNGSIALYLVAGAGLKVAADDESVATATAGEQDEEKFKKENKRSLSEWERDQVIRKVKIKAGATVGSTVLRALDEAGRDLIKPLKIYVVMDQYGRRVGGVDGSGVEPDMRAELQKLTFRQVIARIAQDQMTSGIRQHGQALSAYKHPPNYEPLWCGTFVGWCWTQAAAIKGKGDFSKLFRPGAEALRSPQKAIDWAVKNPGSFKLLRYKGINPMTGKEKVDFAEIGDGSVVPQTGDIALWYNTSGYKNDDAKMGIPGFKHVSFVESFNGGTFTDINGNAWDAGSQSIFARIDHETDKKTTLSKQYRCFFMCVTLPLD